MAPSPTRIIGMSADLEHIFPSLTPFACAPPCMCSGHDNTVFNARRRATIDPQDPRFEELGMGMAQVRGLCTIVDVYPPPDLDVTQPFAGPSPAPFAPDDSSAFRPPAAREMKPLQDRQMDVTDIDGAKPRIQKAYNYQQRDLLRNDDVEGATTWNWKPLHRRFIGGAVRLGPVMYFCAEKL